jgi:hypothetical protein
MMQLQILKIAITGDLQVHMVLISHDIEQIETYHHVGTSVPHFGDDT